MNKGAGHREADMAGNGSLDRLRTLVRANTAWNSEMPHGTGLHRMSCIAEHAMEVIDDVENEVTLGHLALPPDADGTVIRFGDMMVGWYGYDGPLRVDSIECAVLDEGDQPSWTIGASYDDEIPYYAQPEVLRHYVQPTLRAALLDFAKECQEGPVDDKRLDEYEALIRGLAGGGE